MGYDRDQPFSLSDEPLPPALEPNVDALIQQADRERPDLASLRLNQRCPGSLCARPRKICEIRPSALPPWPALRPFGIRGCRKPTAPRASMSTSRF